MSKKWLFGLILAIMFVAEVTVVQPHVQAWTLSSPKVDDRYFINAEIPAEIVFYHEVEGKLMGDVIPLIITPKYIDIPTLRISYSIELLNPLSKAIHIASSEELSENVRPESERQYDDTWAFLDTAIDALVWDDKNTTDTYVSGNKTIDIADITSAYKYVLVIEDTETNNTGADSHIYGFFVNSTTYNVTSGENCATIELMNYNLREEATLWVYINFTQTGLSGTVTLKYLVVNNANFEHIKVYSLYAELAADHRYIEMEINGMNFSALAHTKAIHSTWDPRSALYRYPSFAAYRSRKLTTGVFGWKNLHATLTQLGKKLYGDKFHTYSVNSYKIKLIPGKKLQEEVYKKLQESQRASESYVSAAKKVTSKVIGSSTFAVNIGSQVLQDKVTKAQKATIDVTNGIIASIWGNLGSGAQAAIKNIKGFLKNSTDSVVGLVNHFNEGVNAIVTGVVEWWNKNWGWIAVILVLFIVIAIGLTFMYFYMKTGAISLPGFGTRAYKIYIRRLAKRVRLWTFQTRLQLYIH